MSFASSADVSVHYPRIHRCTTIEMKTVDLLQKMYSLYAAAACMHELRTIHHT